MKMHREARARRARERSKQHRKLSKGDSGKDNEPKGEMLSLLQRFRMRRRRQFSDRLKEKSFGSPERLTSFEHYLKVVSSTHK